MRIIFIGSRLINFMGANLASDRIEPIFAIANLNLYAYERSASMGQICFDCQRISKGAGFGPHRHEIRRHICR